MAKPWARPFYSSSLWKKCRESYKQYKNGLCERCLKEGRYVPGEEVHHKVWLNETNINNPDITLSWDNLELLCSSCHSKEHNSKYESLREDVQFDKNGDLVRRKQE